MTLPSSPLRRIVVSTLAATALVAAALPASAQEPSQTAWWSARHGSLQVNGDKAPMVSTLGVRRQGDTFCGVYAFSVFDENAWVVRGTDQDGHLVVTSKQRVRGPMAELSPDDRLYQDLFGERPQQQLPTEYFVTPTSIVQRIGSLHQGGDYEVYPAIQSTRSTLQAELEQHCGEDRVAGR